MHGPIRRAAGDGREALKAVARAVTAPAQRRAAQLDAARVSGARKLGAAPTALSVAIDRRFAAVAGFAVAIAMRGIANAGWWQFSRRARRPCLAERPRTRVFRTRVSHSGNATVASSV
jgi:hypothetical protein